MIGIIDYGMGNLGSMLNMFKKIGAEACIASDKEVIWKVEKLVLPGVGSFDEGMKNLEERGFLAVLEEKVLGQKAPILGTCLGLQLFTKRSEEGVRSGLGWLNAETVRFHFPESPAPCVPHMGWNTITIRKRHRLSEHLPEEARFYFVHSYHLRCAQPEDVLYVTRYGYEFPSAIAHGNILGVQFHPEKSHKFGMQLLKNFAVLC